jgi:hypothetical protein
MVYVISRLLAPKDESCTLDKFFLKLRGTGYRFLLSEGLEQVQSIVALSNKPSGDLVSHKEFPKTVAVFQQEANGIRLVVISVERRDAENLVSDFLSVSSDLRSLTAPIPLTISEYDREGYADRYISGLFAGPKHYVTEKALERIVLGETPPVKKALVIEGDRDEKFLQTLSLRICDKQLGDLYDIFRAPKGHEQEILVGSLFDSARRIILVRDYNTKSEADVMKEFERVLDGHGGQKVSDTTIEDARRGSQFTLRLAGLPRDPDITSFGIRSHSIEDYLLKLLICDDDVKNWVGCDLGNLKSKASALCDVASLSQAKTIMGVIGVLKDGMEPENVASEIITRAGIPSLRDVLKDLLHDIFDLVG